jgi:hypothetical protein
MQIADVDSKLTASKVFQTLPMIRFHDGAAHKIFGALQQMMESLPTDMLSSSTDRS